MKKIITTIICIVTCLVTFALVMPTLVAAGSPTKRVELKDPASDDFGPGTYVYPTDTVYAPKSFDLRAVEVLDKGSTLQFKVKLGARIRDPWNSREWDGNGFSLQFVQIYLDLDHKAASGYTKPLPGLGSVQFKANEAWDKVVLLSPQGKTRLGAEVRYKARKMKKDVIIPKVTRARGKTLIAVVPKKALGARLSTSWGIQVVVQSNEGYPDKKDILTRRVNENRGEHRFGGGHDSACDPHVLDILAGKAKGSRTEVSAQKAALAYTCNKKIATLPMIYLDAR